MEKIFKEGDIVAFYPNRNGALSQYSAQDGSLAKVIEYNTPILGNEEFLYVEWVHDGEPKHDQQNGGYLESDFRLYQEVNKASAVCKCDIIDIWNVLIPNIAQFFSSISHR